MRNDPKTWSLQFRPSAENQLSALDRAVAERIAKKLRWLVHHAVEVTHLPLRFDLAGFYKLRAGDWRVIYRLLDDERIVLVVSIDHRRDVYR